MPLKDQLLMNSPSPKFLLSSERQHRKLGHRHEQQLEHWHCSTSEKSGVNLTICFKAIKASLILSLRCMFEYWKPAFLLSTV